MKSPSVRVQKGALYALGAVALLGIAGRAPVVYKWYCKYTGQNDYQPEYGFEAVRVSVVAIIGVLDKINGLITAIATGVMAYLAYRQLLAYNLSIKQTEDANNRFIRIEESAHDATQKELRAYLHISKEEVPGLLALNQVLGGATHIKLTETVVYQLDFKNFGQTPAHEVVVDVKTVVDSYPVRLNAKDEWEKLTLRDELVEILGNTIYDGSMGPEGWAGIPVRLSKELTPNEIARLNLGGEEAAIYIYGHIEYHDAFTDDIRITNFCFAHRKNKGDRLFGNTLETWLEGNKAT